jgi:hypothetical protein
VWKGANEENAGLRDGMQTVSSGTNIPPGEDQMKDYVGGFL